VWDIQNYPLLPKTTHLSSYRHIQYMTLIILLIQS
jgi:hypothetical protein